MTSCRLLNRFIHMLIMLLFNLIGKRHNFITYAKATLSCLTSSRYIINIIYYQMRHLNSAVSHNNNCLHNKIALKVHIRTNVLLLSVVIKRDYRDLRLLINESKWSQFPHAVIIWTGGWRNNNIFSSQISLEGINNHPRGGITHIAC